MLNLVVSKETDRLSKVNTVSQQHLRHVLVQMYRLQGEQSSSFKNRLPQESCYLYRSAGKSLARPTSRCILFDGENISFDASLVLYIYMNSTNIPPIMIINRIYETQNLLLL